MNKRFLRIALASVFGLAVAFGIATWQVRNAAQSTGPTGGTVTGTTVGGSFELVDHTGRTVTDQTFRGRFMLVYFGYTFCPDICPTDLQTMVSALDRLGPQAERVQPVFITVDPQRDTVAHLAEYMPLFGPELIGLTGSDDAIARTARAYKVYYARNDDGGSTDYLMDHSAFMYLMDPEGTFVTVFGHGTSADAIAEGIRAAIEAG